MNAVYRKHNLPVDQTEAEALGEAGLQAVIDEIDYSVLLADVLAFGEAQEPEDGEELADSLRMVFGASLAHPVVDVTLDGETAVAKSAGSSIHVAFVRIDDLWYVTER